MAFETKTIEAPGLRRELKARHLTMIAIGGSIDTGLSAASGAAISQADSDEALFSYVLIGLMVYFPMTGLGELAAYMPVSGSFVTYGQNYVEEGFGFTLNWNCRHNWVATIAVDLVAAQLIMSWWFPDTPGWIWSVLFLGAIFLLNYISVRGFGEAKYRFSLIKVTTAIVFIIVGMLTITDILKGIQPVGWSNWAVGEAPFAGGFAAVIDIATIVGFSFQGTKLIGIAAGKSEDSAKSTPHMMRQVFWRILLFCMLMILITGLIILYTDPSLLHNDVKDISVSPSTLVFQHTDLLPAVAAMNTVTLTVVLSMDNSGMYASTRTLYTLAYDGKAPHISVKPSRDGVSCNALYATTVIVGLCSLTSMFGNQTVYLWLLNTSGVTGFIAWLGIVTSHYHFHRGYVLQEHDVNDLPYRSGLSPLGPIFAFILCLITTLGQSCGMFLEDTIDWGGVAATHTDTPLLLIARFGHELIRGTHFVRYSGMKFPQNDKK